MLMKGTGFFTVVNPVLPVVNVSTVAVRWWKTRKSRGVSDMRIGQFIAEKGENLSLCSVT